MVSVSRASMTVSPFRFKFSDRASPHEQVAWAGFIKSFKPIIITKNYLSIM